MPERITPKAVLRFVLVTIGVLIFACSMQMFLLPNYIAPGGVTGLATIAYHLFKVPVGVVIMVCNLPLYLLSIRRFGAWYSFMTLYAATLSSAVIDYVPMPVVTTDPMLASLIGGIVMGFGVGLTDRNGGNTGCTFLLAKLIQLKFPFLSIAWMMFFVDAVVVALSCVAFGVEIGLFALIALYVGTKVMDLTLTGIRAAREVKIISDCAEKIGMRITNEMERGATKLIAEGVYTHQPRGMLLCVLESGRELQKLKEIVQMEDPKAFIIVNHTSEVLGEGFSSYE